MPRTPSLRLSRLCLAMMQSEESVPHAQPKSRGRKRREAAYEASMPDKQRVKLARASTPGPPSLDDFTVATFNVGLSADDAFVSEFDPTSLERAVSPCLNHCNWVGLDVKMDVKTTC